MIDSNQKERGNVPPLLLPRMAVLITQEVNGVYSLYR